MATENDRAVLDCIINPVLPSSDFNSDLSSTEENDGNKTSGNAAGKHSDICYKQHMLFSLKHLHVLVHRS